MSIKQQKYLIGGILAIVIVAYNMVWLNTTFTMSEGWARFYYALIEKGMVPYRDFYYFLPPLNLFVDSAIWSVSGDYFIVYRFWRLLERVIIVELMYAMLSKRCGYFVSFLVCIGSAVLASANNYDLIGDYNQTAQLLIVLFTAFFLNYENSNDSSWERWLWVVCIGISGGLMFLTKQTIVLAAGVIGLVLFIFLWKTKAEKRPLRFLFCIITGAIIPIGMAFIYLYINGALGDFIYQVFQDVSSKGTLFSIVVRTQWILIKTYRYLILGLLFIFGSLLFHKKRIYLPVFLAQSVNVNKVAKGFFILGIICLMHVCLNIFWETASMFFKSYIIFLLVSAIFGWKKIINSKNSVIQAVSISFLLLIIGLFLLNNIHNSAYLLYRKTGVFWFIPTIISISYIVLSFIFLKNIYKLYKFNDNSDWLDLIIVSGAIISGWSSSMSTGGTNVNTISAFIVIPALFMVGWKYVGRVNLSLLSFVILAIFCVCIAQKVENPYSWWGDSEAARYRKTVYSDIPQLKGFKFTESEKERYDTLCEIIKENTNEHSVIWGFPYTKVYNVFLNNYNMKNFVPVLFYDVCADDFAKQDAKILSENEPDIVIWQTIPRSIEVHEKTFRNGKPLGQRDIIEWFDSKKDSDYLLVGTWKDIYYESIDNDENIYIYRKK